MRQSEITLRFLSEATTVNFHYGGVKKRIGAATANDLRRRLRKRHLRRSDEIARVLSGTLTSIEGAIDSEPLQTEEKYFFIMGRTQDFFGSSANTILTR